MHGTNNEPQTQPATRDPNLQDIKTKMKMSTKNVEYRGERKKKEQELLILNLFTQLWKL